MPHYDEARGLLASDLNGKASILAATVHAAASKATPVDADELPLVDSAASFGLAKLTWANLKATLATWLNGGTIPAKFTTLVATGALTTAGLKEDASGNLGLVNPPSAWGAGYSVLQQKTYGSSYDWNGGVCGIAVNAYNNGTNWIYRATNFAARYEQSAGGGHAWYTAPSGSAGNLITFTQALAINSSGSLQLLSAPTASAPAYSKGAIYFDTTLNKLRIGGATAWETVTSV